MFTHLLVPVDGSEPSQRAMETGIALAGKLGAAITALIAEPPAPPPMPCHGAGGYLQRIEEHERATADHAERVFDTFELRAALARVRLEGVYARSDQIVPAILEAARQRGCDLIVMATHIHGLYGEWLSPSNAKGVMARSSVPLLVVH